MLVYKVGSTTRNKHCNAIGVSYDRAVRQGLVERTARESSPP